MFAVGIDVGGTSLKAALVDDQGKIYYKKSVPTAAERPGEEIMKDVEVLVRDVVTESGHTLAEIAGVGLGIPGLVDADNGRLVYSCNLPTCDNIDLRASIGEPLGLPLYVDNDANVAALGESIYGAGKGQTRCSVLITLGTGLGGGVIIDGKIFAGAFHGGTELGHHVIIENGEQCGCGRKGCWEAYSSATGLIREARKAAEANHESLLWKLCGGDLSRIDGKLIGEAEDADDEATKAVMKEYIHHLAIGIGNMYNIFQPEVFMIGGGISGRGDKLLKPLLEALPNEVYGGDISKLQLLMAELGNDAGVIGAAALVFTA